MINNYCKKAIMVMLVLMLFTAIRLNAETLSITTDDLGSGMQGYIDIAFMQTSDVSTIKYSGLNAKLMLPNGLQVTGISKGSLINGKNFTLDGHFDDANNTYSFVGFSLTDTFAGNGTFVRLSVSVDESLVGDHPVTFNLTIENLVNPLALALIPTTNDPVNASVPGATNKTVAMKSDYDGDGMPNVWELQYGLDPYDISDGGEDKDQDGLSNLGEFYAGLKPNNPDSDGDGMWDLWELTYNLNPSDDSDATIDSDGDGATNLAEFNTGGNPMALDITGDLKSGTYQSFKSVQSKGVCTVLSGNGKTTIIANTGYAVILKAGFHAEEGSDLEVKIDSVSETSTPDTVSP